MTLAAAPAQLNAPSIAYHALWPIFIVLGVACVGVLVEAFVPRTERYATQLGLFRRRPGCRVYRRDSAARHVIDDGGRCAGHRRHRTISPRLHPRAGHCWPVLLIAERSLERSPIVAQAAVVVGSPRDRELARTGRIQTEVFPLAMFAVGGMLIFPVSNNLLLMFVALEVLSLPLYLMAGMARHRRLLSQEAAMKYFLLGAFASAFFLYGIALLYGYANSVDLSAILAAASTSNKPDALLYLGLALLLVGVVLQGQRRAVPQLDAGRLREDLPPPSPAFMAACTKVAAFGAIIRVLYVGFASTKWDWRPIIWAVAITSMVVGAVFALTQTNVKRILAYSSIAHAGFILVGIVAVTRDGHSKHAFLPRDVWVRHDRRVRSRHPGS